MSGALNPELRALKTTAEEKGTKARESVGGALSDANFWRDSFGLLFFVLAGIAVVYLAITRGPELVALVRTPGFFQRPEVRAALRDAAICAATVAVLLAVYYYVLRPQVILDPRRVAQVCPDRWVYNDSTQLCEPRYKTECPPFHPDRRHPMSRKEMCEVAQKCGTNWAGACD